MTADGASFKKTFYPRPQIVQRSTLFQKQCSILIGRPLRTFRKYLEMAKMSKCQQLLRGFEPMTSQAFC